LGALLKIHLGLSLLLLLHAVARLFPEQKVAGETAATSGRFKSLTLSLCGGQCREASVNQGNQQSFLKNL
jgi:hypothetical protein